MRKTIIILCFSMISSAIHAQKNAKKNTTAKIEFKTDVIDYGEITKGSDGIRQFEFTNTGDAPLIISRVYSSCGCTIPKKPEEPIAPGKTGTIEVKYDTKRVGPIRKTITVYSNAEESTVAIKIKGTILDVDDTKSKSILEKSKDKLPIAE